MERNYQLVTNNRKTWEKYEDHDYIGVIYMEDGSFLDVLVQTRDMLHRGWHLLSHPQASNLKPNQCPYKSILISRKVSAADRAKEIEMIEGSIAAYEKFTRGMIPPAWSEEALGDFQTVDLAVIESAVYSSLMQQMMLGNV